ncbi:MAG: hypothetical protein MPN21_06735 [Thermoanaerobaculia bacterium]|nr:hypothetical protein [Thermoanaerobaculia bacterium]
MRELRRSPHRPHTLAAAVVEALRLLAVYGASCALVLWLIHRKLRTVSLGVALVLSLLPFAFTGTAMLTGGLYGGLNLVYNTPPLASDRGQLPELKYRNGILMDQVCQVIPWRKAVRESVKTGHWPLWNRYSRGGDVLLGLSQPAPFDPKVWIGFLLPLATAITFACSFVLFQAAGFTWLYLRELGLGDGAALVGGVTYMASSFLTFWVTWSMSSVWAVLPLLVFGVHRLAHGSRGGFGATVTASTLALVGGHPESVLHIATAAGVVLLAEWPWREGFATTASRLRRAVVAALVAGALAAPAVLPFVDAMKQTSDYRGRLKNTVRHQGLELTEASRSLLGTVLPWAYGLPHHKLAETKPKGFNDAAFASVGGAAWILAVAGLATGRRRSRLFASMAGFSVLVACHFPFVTEILGTLPLYRIALNERLAGVTVFCLAVLAAFGTESLTRGDSRTVRMATRALLLGASLLTALALWHLAAADLSTAVSRSFSRSLPAVLLPALALAFAGRQIWFRRAACVSPLILAMVLLPRPLEKPGVYRTFPVDLFFPPLPELETLPSFQEDGSEPYRVTGSYSDLVPAIGTLWHLEDPRGYATMRNLRQHKTLSLWCDLSTAWWFCQVRELDRPFLSALGVRYLLARPNRIAAEDWTLVTRGENMSIWENPRALPRAFAPDRVLRIDPEEDPLSALARLRDFRRAAAIEFDAWPKPTHGSGKNPNFRRNPSGDGRADVNTRAEGPDLVISVDAPGPTWVVVSETPWRGWRAVDQDGNRLKLTYANVSMLAFQAPEGRSEVRLTFWPASFTAGLLLAALALVALSAAHLLRIRRRLRLRR